jgi:galactokinase
MTLTGASGPPNVLQTETLQAALAAHPPARGQAATVTAPAVADVMGGIGEDNGCLILTTTVGLSLTVSAWHIAANCLRLLLATEAGAGPTRQLDLPMALVGAVPHDPAVVMDACRREQAEWAIPAGLVVGRAMAEGVLPRPPAGLAILVQSDLPPDVDLGRHTVLGTAALESLCRLGSHALDRGVKSQFISDSLLPFCGVPTRRTALTTLSARPDGALLQLRFHLHPLCESLALPGGILICVARTSLARPVSRERLVETATCAAMGQRMIVDLRESEPAGPMTRADRLAAITPTEYVERYRDRLPSKITGKAFVERFGALRGINGELDPRDIYKVRSRAEHHIYENRRVDEFATCLSRARRTNSPAELVHAGELMYASHWSHSQRCGIGGVETDRLVSNIRKHGPAAGLFGAKVTAGGNGGEMVILMRDTDQAHAALAASVRATEAACHRSIDIFRCAFAGAEAAPAGQAPGRLATTSV